MDFQSMMETFAEAWVAANTQTPLTEAAEQGLLLNSSSLALGGQSLDMAFDTPCGRRSARDSTSSSLAMAQSSSQSSQQTTINADDESASPLTACPSFGAQTDFKSGIPSNNTLGRTSIPIHCIVERVAAPGNASVPCSSSSTSGGSGGTAGSGSGIAGSQSQSQSQPTHSLSQQSSSAVTSSIASLPLPATTSSSSIESLSSCSVSSPIIEQDSYAIISSAVLFIDLVRTALLRLGYSASETVGAKGVIQIKNWKPLTFEQITDNVEATVGDILGDIASVSTLKIRLYSLSLAITEWTHYTVREAVLELLREISQSKLSKLCHISQPLLSSIVNNKHDGKIGKRKCEEFGKWYCDYRRNNPVKLSACSGEQNTAAVLQIDSNTEDEGCAQKVGDTTTSHVWSETGEMRLTFHATIEVPQLRHWYRVNPKPSDRMLMKYCDILNQSSLRQERNRVTVKSLKNWWKNERQRERKQLKSQTIRTSTKLSKCGEHGMIDRNLLEGIGDSLTQSTHSSDDEPTLTMAFTNNDNDEDMI